MSWSNIIKREELESVEVLPFDLPDFSDEVPAGSIFLPEEHRSIPSARARKKKPPAGAQEAIPAEERALQVKEEIPAPPAPQPAVEVTEELKRKLFEQGYEQGQRVGQELAEKKLEPVTKRFEEATRDLNELRSKIIKRSERNIVDLALEISQKIIQRELSLDPEILVVDLSLPMPEGDSVIRDLRACYPDLKFIVLSLYDDPIAMERVMTDGAFGYVLKRAIAIDLLDAIDEVRLGHIFVSSVPERK